jgi:ZIP family zinc transporter
MSSTLIDVLFASFWAGALATGLGALPVLLMSSLSARTRAGLSGFSAGVMLAASFFSLLAPGLERSAAWGRWPSITAASLSVLLGAGVIAAFNRLTPHEHFIKGPEGPGRDRLARIWLFVFAITLHNFPEGLAIGVTVSSGDAALGLPLTTGIALQNIPEGLVVAVSLVKVGYARSRALFVAFLTGLVEPLGAVAGSLGVGLAAGALPIGLFLSAGAMIYVVSDEIIPESHESEHASFATWTTLVGFVLMMALDVGLG